MRTRPFLLARNNYGFNLALIDLSDPTRLQTPHTPAGEYPAW